MIVPVGGMAPAVKLAMTGQAMTILILACAIFLLPATRSGGRFLIDGLGLRAEAARVAVLLLLPLALVMAFAGDYSPFLYFQF
jgi:hypothetical protein